MAFLLYAVHIRQLGRYQVAAGAVMPRRLAYPSATLAKPFLMPLSGQISCPHVLSDDFYIAASGPIF